MAAQDFFVKTACGRMLEQSWLIWFICNATKADEPKAKQDGAIIFCRGPYSLKKREYTV
jgi:hypothetical protein